MQLVHRPLLACIMFVGLLFVLAAHPLPGQGPRASRPFPGYAPMVPHARFRISADSSSRKRTYWVEGGVIGALGGLLVANALNGLACQDSSNCGGDRAMLIGLVGGFVVGSLIGGGIEKKP